MADDAIRDVDLLGFSCWHAASPEGNPQESKAIWLAASDQDELAPLAH